MTVPTRLPGESYEMWDSMVNDTAKCVVCDERAGNFLRGVPTCNDHFEEVLNGIEPDYVNGGVK